MAAAQTQQTISVALSDMEKRKDLPVEERARRLAEKHQILRKPGRPVWMTSRLKAQEEFLNRAYKYFLAAPSGEPVRSYAAEWVLDNFYVVQQALREVREDMPAGYYHQLPKLKETGPEPIPRVFAIAQEIFHACGTHLNIELLTRFTQAYQEVSPLLIGEVWALPTMLRIIVIEYLTAALINITGLPFESGHQPSAISAPPEEIAAEVLVANCILSLRMLSDEDWKAFFEQVSLVEQTLRRDPAGVYTVMDFDTRDSYRKKVEQLALVAGRNEVDVAREAVHLAERLENRTSVRLSHVGYYLLDKGQTLLERRVQYHPGQSQKFRRWLLRHPTPVYLCSIGILFAAFLIALISYSAAIEVPAIQVIIVSILFSIPALRIAAGIVNWIITHLLPPRILPKMDFREGVPAEYRTMVIIPTLLTSADEVRALLQRLERHFLGNTDPHVSFALLGDFADAPLKHMPNDEAILAQAVRGIQDLNARHAFSGRQPFFFFNREREWNDSEGVWMGWERKRGNLQQFNRLILGRPSSYRVQVGDVNILPKVKYVITLDADTILPRDAARRLAATLAHPLNQAQLSAPDRLDAGYFVLQPRTEVNPTSSNQSLFTRIFAGDTGIDLYTRAVSDVYQDFFGEGIYVGKGIYDVAAFDTCLSEKMPENAVLSHDLIEGLHGRVALVTDIVFLEDYPGTYLTYMHRYHRWVRGDWQLLPWLFSGKLFHREKETRLARLPLISRWKIFDNMCRSLVSPALFALLVLSWFWLSGSALVWTLIFVLAAAVPLAVSLTIDWAAKSSLHLLAMRVARWLLVLVFLPYEALMTTHAIGGTLFRLAVTRKHLLKWTSAAHAVRLFGKEKKLLMFWRQMLFAPAAAVAIGTALALLRLRVLSMAAPFLIAWFVSPQVAYYLSAPHLKKTKPLSGEQRARLRRIARRTWFFFEHFVGPEDHWLPPDHFQENPRGLVAHRTSVTNIGLMLASIIAANDLGYIGTLDLVSRLRNAFETMDLLERYRGHFLNWYDTRTLEPLPARYVSTVDSGNLAASLILLNESLQRLPEQPVVPEARWSGLVDTIDVFDEVLQTLRYVPADAVSSVCQSVSALRERIEQVRQKPDIWFVSLTGIHEQYRLELERRLMDFIERNAARLDASSVTHLRMWFERINHQLHSIQREFETLEPWLTHLANPPALLKDEASPAANDYKELCILLQNPGVNKVSAACHEARIRLEQIAQALAAPALSNDERNQLTEWLKAVQDSLAIAQENAQRLLDDYSELALRAGNYVNEMQFAFLFDPKREIFYIGYNVDSEQLDNNRYDLLASEARIASIIAIAKGDVPQSHWLHLARPLASVDGMRVLMSWAGTMFEYLMPALFVRHYENTLLEQSCRGATRRQIEYCRKRDVPWGVSESGYYRFDVNLNYQYRAFGTPGLGFKRGLGEDLVVAPYASLLALSVEPEEVMRNVERLVKLQMLGLYGFYEAADYTPSRLILGQERSIVRSFMSHHQSMILLSLENYLSEEIMVRRVHSQPMIQSVELLLQEQVPYRAPLEEIPGEEVAAARLVQPAITATPWQVPVQSAFPHAYYLSNGSYGTLITAAGSGFSSWKEMDVTRWRADTTLDDWGIWIYVQDLDSGELGSVGYQPAGAAAQEREVFFYPHKTDFRSRMGDIIVHMEVTVPPEDDGEIRRLTLTNQSSWPRRLAVTSYGEVVLSAHEPDKRHPAFNKMFIESEFVPQSNALLFRRRIRSPDDPRVHLAHALVLEPGVGAAGMHETDRRRFVGRGGDFHKPASIGPEGTSLSNTTGATLDPIFALSQEVIIEPHASARVAFITMIAERRSQVLALTGRYQDWPIIDRAFEMARARSEMELRQLKLSVADLELYQQMLSLLMYPHASLRAEPSILAANTKGQSSLWRFSISGDYPLLLLRVGREEETALVHELLKAHTYWRNRSLKIDLVILNMLEAGYSQELHDQLQRLLSRTNNDTWLNQRGGIFLLRADQMSDSERVLLATVARIILDGDKGSLASQLQKLKSLPTYLPAFVPTPPEGVTAQRLAPVERPRNLQFDNGIGGFGEDGREYLIYLKPGQQTPRPWINVISNPEFGFLASEAGGGFTWAVNSGENRLTSWTNDPVLDRPSEVIYLRDEETAEIWTPTPLPAGAPEPYLIRHGAGYSVFEHHSHGARQVVTMVAAPMAPVKIVQVHMVNQSPRVRRITMTYYCDWALGNSRDTMQQYIIPEFYKPAYALLARNPYNTDFEERVAFLASTRAPFGLTTDRTEFLGRLGDLRAPAALRRVGLSGTVTAGSDPCAALQLHIDLYPNESVDEFFLIGQAYDRRSALKIIEEYQDPARIENALEEVQDFWDNLFSGVTAATPDPAMNLLLNRWLLYQDLSCRVWGRSALYQSSGAYGFRDQLQDVLALLHVAPEITREHILRAARHQFDAGDVLHWWHPPSGKGVRTRTSDDLLWLPFVTAQYVEATGDTSILEEQSPFLRADPLKPEEAERYGEFPSTIDAFSLYEHCKRAIAKGSTSGAHGLPLMGTGDWNDGMNLIGARGFGESVWVGWFLSAVLKQFIPICRTMGDEEAASAYLAQAENLQRALESGSWDGEWYLRAYHDDGSLVGSASSGECRIDSITQSWALLSETGDRERAQKAMEAALNSLVQTREELVLLFTPPFDKTPHDPGYIKGYPPGVRENGGQYTHAALWLAWAFTLLGDGDRAEQLFRLLNPLSHADTPEKIEIYQVEPYVVAADVYSMHPFTGRGGWTWYTGSAGWMYRLGIEAILGLRRKRQFLEIRPCIPREWPDYEITYRYGRTEYHIRVQNPNGVTCEVSDVILDGRALPDKLVPLADDGQAHWLIVRMGRR